MTFQNAERELRRLYPNFAGPITSAILLRNSGPAANPARRIR
jgi:hypothetical protein